MNDNWWELPNMSAGQAQDFVDNIRALNDSIANSSINDGCDINDDMRAVADYNHRIENNLPLRPDKKCFEGALDKSGQYFRFTKK